MADCHLAIGERLTADKDFPAAIRPLESARAILEPIAAKHPDVAAYEESLAECYKEMGIAQAGQGFPERGLESLEKAEIIQKRLIDRSPRGCRVSEEAGGHHQCPGLRLLQARRLSRRPSVVPGSSGHLPVPARSHHVRPQAGPAPQFAGTRPLQHRDRRAPERPSRGGARRLRTLARIPIDARGRASFGDRFPGESRREPRRDRPRPVSRETRPGGVRLDPEVDRHPGKAGRFAAGSAAFPRRAGSELERPGLPPRRGSGTMRRRSRISRERSPSRNAPWRHLRRWTEYKNQLCVELENLGEQYVNLGSVDEGLPHYRRAIGIRESTRRRPPGQTSGSRSIWRINSLKLGTILRHGGDSASAHESFARAHAESWIAFAGSATVDSPREGRLGLVLTGEALALADQGRRSEAMPILRRAVAILKPLGTATKGDDPARGWLSESIWELGRLLRAEGSAKEADLLDAERLALVERCRAPGTGEARPRAVDPSRPGRIRENSDQRPRPVRPRDRSRSGRR